MITRGDYMINGNFKVRLKRISDDFFGKDAPNIEYTYNDDEDSFVSDIIDNNIVENWNNTAPVFITCQTGKGKTHFIKEAIMPKAYKEGTSILLLVNRTALARQIKRDIAKEISLTYGDTNPEEAMSLLNEDGLDKMEKFGFVTILTYQAITNLDEETLNYNNYSYVIADEAHFFTSDSTFNPDTYRILKKLIKCFENSVRIYMTATPEVCFEPIFRAEHRNPSKELIPKIYDTGRNYNYINHFYLLHYLAEDKKITDLGKIIESVPEKDKVLIFVSSKSFGDKLAKTLKNDKIPASFISPDGKEYIEESDTDDISAAFISSEKKDSETFNQLVNKEKFTEKVLISTSVADNGINIKDTSVKHVIIDSYDRTSFLQMLGRVRISKEQKINLYVFPHTDENLENMIADAQQELALRIMVTATKPTSGELKKDIFKDRPGFSVDVPEIYFSEASLYTLLNKISKLRRILRLHYKNSSYFPNVTEKQESYLAHTRKYCNVYPELELRLLDALTTQRSYDFVCRQAKRDGKEYKRFVNKNDYESFIIKKRLDILHNRIKNEPLSKELIEKVQYLDHLLSILNDLPDNATIEATPPGIGYIAAEYANFLGVSSDRIEEYKGKPVDDAPNNSLESPEQPISEHSAGDVGKEDDIVALIKPLVVSKDDYNTYITDMKCSPDSWPWLEKNGFTNKLNEIDERHKFHPLIEALSKHYNVKTKQIIEKFNKDDDFKKWKMVVIKCSSNKPGYPVHYVLIER